MIDAGLISGPAALSSIGGELATRARAGVNSRSDRPLADWLTVPAGQAGVSLPEAQEGLDQKRLPAAFVPRQGWIVCSILHA